MQIRRPQKYRLYPTPVQEATFLRWERALRDLWNAGLAQYLHRFQSNLSEHPKSEDEADKIVLRQCGRILVDPVGFPPTVIQVRKRGAKAGDRKYRSRPDNFTQALELTEAQEVFPWLKEVNRHCKQAVLDYLNDAWVRCFKKLAGRPRFKGRKDPVNLYQPYSKGSVDTFEIEGRFLHLTGGPAMRSLGPLLIKVDRPLDGRVTGFHIVRDVDEWYVIFNLELTIDDPLPSEKPAVGIDRGVALMLADSDGRRVENPKYGAESAAKLAHLQRQLSRKEKFSANWRKTKQKIARLQRDIARQREWTLHHEANYYANNYGQVFLEDLHVKNMTASAKGTVEQPGENVRAKAGLNRSILDVAWGRFGNMVSYKTAAKGASTSKVRAHFTSQKCPKCGCTDEKNRPSQSVFRCIECGYEENADVVGAINVRDRGLLNEVVERKPVQQIRRRRSTGKSTGNGVKPDPKGSDSTSA
jgi:putative transposase